MAGKPSPRTFVLLHGAFHGGWCWRKVADILEARGHRVTTPTQTGLGERAHLLTKSISIDDFVEDVVQHLRYEDLADVVLVGHSFGGMAITGAAEAVPERLSRLIYLDAAVPASGEAPFDLLPQDIVAERVRIAEETSGGLSIPAPPATAFGLSRPADIAFVEPRLTPHPLATYQTALTLKGRAGNGLPCHYITCTDPVYAPLETSRQRARDYGWPTAELATGHDAMVAEPAATADLLETLGG